MSRFFKFLIIVAAVVNLAFVFVFDGRIPSNIPIPFVKNAEESEETLPESDVLQPDDAEVAEEETEVLPEEAAAEGTEEEELTEETEEETAVPRCRIISAGGSNVRSGPGSSFEVLTSYPYDTVLILTGEAEIGWYPILAEDGTEGYIFESQVEILEENAAEDVPVTEEINQ